MTRTSYYSAAYRPLPAYSNMVKHYLLLRIWAIKHYEELPANFAELAMWSGPKLKVGINKHLKIVTLAQLKLVANLSL